MKAQRVFISGSSSGIGYSLAEYFIQRGYQVVLHGVGPEVASAATSLKNQFDCSCLHYDVDLRDPKSIHAMMADVQEKLGGVDVLINNAGIQHVSTIAEFPDTKWNDILAINLSSVFHLSKFVWPSMKAQGFGRIINVSSVHGLRASEFKSAYVAAKHGVLGLTKVLALEGAPFGITVNAVCPGYVKTPLVERQILDQSKAHGISPEEVVEKVMLKKQAVKDFISFTELNEMVGYLANPTTKSVTGASFVLDGGWTVQ